MSTNCRNGENQMNEGKTNKIPIFENQFFFSRQKQFRCANIDAQSTIKPGLLKDLFKYF